MQNSGSRPELPALGSELLYAKLEGETTPPFFLSERKKMKILILTQLPIRDTPVDKLIAKHLRKMGHTVWVEYLIRALGTETPGGRKAVQLYKPELVVTPDIRGEYSRDLNEALRGMGLRTVLRRSEPGYSKDFRKTITDEFATAIRGRWAYTADLELVWNEEFLEPLNNPVAKAVGAFAFDVFFLKKKKKHKRKTVLCASAWDYADRTPEYSIPEVAKGSPLHKEHYWRCRNGRDLWIKEILKAVDKYPDWHFILKTHPAEVPFEYMDTFGDKVEIMYLPPSIEALATTDILIHAGSTMAAEAHLWDIPAFRLGGEDDHPLAGISPEINEIDLDDVELGKSNADIGTLKYLEKTFFGTMDGKACLRAAEEINKIKPPHEVHIPQRWPDSPNNYETPDTRRYLSWEMFPMDCVHCPACKNLAYLRPKVNLAKCPHCAVMFQR